MNESLASGQPSTREKRRKKNKNGDVSTANAGASAAECAQRCRPSSKPSADAVEALEEALAEHEAQHKVDREEYVKLEDKFSRLRKQTERIKEQRDDFHEQHNELKQQHEQLQEEQRTLQYHFNHASERYTYILRNTIQPFVESKGLHWNDQTAETISVVLDPLIADAIEASSLREQVRVLQKEMLAKLNKVQVVSDEQFAQDFRNLVAIIKTLSRTVHLSPDRDVVGISGTPAFLQGVNQRHWKSRAGKKCLVEAWVWCVLLDLVFQSPFAMFGEEGECLQTVWQGIFGVQHAHSWPTPTALCETWRYTTTEQLTGQADLVGAAAGKSKPDMEYKHLEMSMLATRSNVKHIIAEYVARISATTDSAVIGSIVDKAFALALRMSSQRFRLQITYPSVGMMFHRDSMCTLPDPDGEDSEEGTVAFVVHPGLTKWGDAYGKNLDQRFDIVSSLVQLDAPESSHPVLGVKHNI